MLINAYLPIPFEEIKSKQQDKGYSKKIFIIPCFRDEDDPDNKKKVVVFCNKRGIGR